MKYIDLRENEDYEKIDEASLCLKQGGLVLFPTETVYGIGANGLNETAVRKIYEAKGRASDNPLILHIADFAELDNIAKDITDTEMKLMDAFWPGPFTIVLKKKDNVPSIVTAGLDTVAVRMPKNKIAHELIKKAKVPVAAPSANISGKPSGTNVGDIFSELKDKMDYIIDGGDCEVGVESTVVIVIDGMPKILRPGAITAEMIEKVIGSVMLDEHIFESVKEGDKVLSPGMKYKHYAPNSKCVLVYGENNEKMVGKINEIVQEYSNAVVICSDKNSSKYSCKNVIAIGDTKEQICKNIFKILRKVDEYLPDIVVIEGVSKNDLGLAIMNRLIRSCDHNYIEVK